MNYKRLAAVSLGHFAIDILSSSVAIILTAMAGRFELGNTEIATGVMIYTLASALTQPLFGVWADRLQGRWLGALGLLWTMSFYFMASFAPTFPLMLTLLTLGAFGSAAFHPVGTMTATAAGRVRAASSATSIFFLLGQSGLALGPVLAGWILQRYGVSGLPFLAVAMTPAMLFMAFALREPIVRDEVHTRAQESANQAAPASWAVLGAFMALIALRSATLQTFMALLPKFFADQNIDSAAYGRMLGIFVFSGAIGTFTGGILGDRFNQRKLITFSLWAAIPFNYLVLTLDGGGYVFAAMAAGFLMSISHSILVVIAQRLLPRNQGLASGAILGFMFASGAAFTGLAGWVADSVGLSVVLHVLAFLPLITAPIALLLPGRQDKRPPQTAPAPV